MNKGFFFCGLFILAVVTGALYSTHPKNARAASLRNEKTLVLYDAASGAIPNDALMDFTDFPPGAASLTYADNVTVLDTSLSGEDTFAGWVSGLAFTPAFPVLDRTDGFQVNFILQLESESHLQNNRAGFSIIVLDREAKGIELAFWENEIWAQNDNLTGKLFTHGESIAFSTTTGFTEYQLSIVGDTYTLTANAQPILSGPVRDYSKFDGFPDPYETPNFLFLGDDTSVAESRLKLRFVSITGTEPVVPEVTVTSTSSPESVPSLTTFPSATPLPSPTTPPSGNIFEFCSSGWVLTIATGSVLVSRRVRRGYKKHS